MIGSIPLRHCRSRMVKATTIAIACAGAILAPASVSATTATGSFQTPPTPYENIGNYNPRCKNVDVRVHYDYEGVYSVKNVAGTNGQAFLSKDDHTFTETWKLQETSKTLLTVTGSRVNEEISAKRVAKADVPDRLIPKQGLVGPIYRFTATEDATITVRDADGTTLVHSYGTRVFKVVLDTLGDSEPGGRVLSFGVASVSGPHPALNECQLSTQIVN